MNIKLFNQIKTIVKEEIINFTNDKFKSPYTIQPTKILQTGKWIELEDDKIDNYPSLDANDTYNVKELKNNRKFTLLIFWSVGKDTVGTELSFNNEEEAINSGWDW